MSAPLIVRVHMAASVAAISLITTFFISSTITEIFGGTGDIRVLRNGIVLGLPLLIAFLAIAGLTGRHLANGSRSAIVRRKRRRLQLAGAVGLLVLVPCALILDHLVSTPAIDRTFIGLEIIELFFGAINLLLLVLNFRDGRRMTRHRRPVQVARRVGSRS